MVDRSKIIVVGSSKKKLDPISDQDELQRIHDEMKSVYSTLQSQENVPLIKHKKRKKYDLNTK